MIYTIYKATNTKNGKAYIGFDSDWPSRKSCHLCEGLTRKNKIYPFYRALQKYGQDAFEWEILYQSEDRDHTLNTMENHFIVEHNTFNPNGYNLTLGGEATFGWIPTVETRKKISDSKTGRPSGMKGLKRPWLSERNRQRAGGKVPGKQKEYTFLKNGVPVTFKGLVDYCKEHGLHAGNMSSVYSGKLNSYREYKKF